MPNKRAALIVANNSYGPESGFTKLVAPPQDADALAAVLSNPAIGDFEVQTLKNETSQAVIEAIESLFVERAREDVLLFYFSGHGIKDEDGQLYFVMANTRRNRLRSTAIKATHMTEIMMHSRSRQQVILLDCCYGGAFMRGMQFKGDENVHTQEYLTGRGRAILSASDAIQYAFEGEEVIGSPTLSLFTQTLVHGLEKGAADTDRDGQIYFDELSEYIERQIADKTPNQRPMKWELDVQGKILIAHCPKTDTSSVVRQEIEVGDLVDDRYLVKRLDRRTPISLMFLVRDLKLERLANLIILYSYIMQEQKILASFEAEGMVLATLVHPNIVHVYDRGKYGGRPYTVTQYLPGGNLAQKLRGGKLSHNEIKAIIFPILDAINYIHRRGIVHRNITPASIHFDDKNTPFLIDFSIAKIKTNGAKNVEDELDNIMLGTPNYGSPEQARGDNTDARSDLYSFGVVLYQMIAGRVPFESDNTLSVLYMQIHQPPPPIEGISHALQVVLNRMLAKNPEDRYQSAQDLEEALSNVL